MAKVSSISPARMARVYRVAKGGVRKLICVVQTDDDEDARAVAVGVVIGDKIERMRSAKFQASIANKLIVDRS